MIENEREMVGLLGCQILNVVMEVGEIPEPPIESETSLKVDFNILSQAEDDRPCGVEVLAYLRIDDASVYSLDIAGRVIFDIPEEYSHDEATEYLSKFGATRAFDCLRPHMEYLANVSGFSGLDIPPIVAEIG